METICEMTEAMIEQYRNELVEQEKSIHTIHKYIRDVHAFFRFLTDGDQAQSAVVDKPQVMRFKEELQRTYQTTSVNSILAAVNSFLKFMRWDSCCVKQLKCQRRIFREEEKELTKAEYMRLLAAAKAVHKERLILVMETICATGIRVSELRFITADAVRCGHAEIACKGKRRTIFLPAELCKRLTAYLRKEQRNCGCVFCTKHGNPLDRSNIWSDMKALCRAANVNREKIFPHNLRHLFAHTFYTIEKDIVRLADILGHSSIETARIYMSSSGAEYAKKIGRLGLLYQSD